MTILAQSKPTTRFESKDFRLTAAEREVLDAAAELGAAGIKAPSVPQIAKVADRPRDNVRVIVSGLVFAKRWPYPIPSREILSNPPLTQREPMPAPSLPKVYRLAPPLDRFDREVAEREGRR